MLREHCLIQNESLGRPYHLWRYGHFGPPLLVFPSAAGMAHEWEAQGMVEALEDLIEAGKLKLYCTESNVAEAWTRRESDPAWRIERHRAFERYVVGDLADVIRRDCRSPEIPIAVAGTSLGAYYSLNFMLKYPETFPFALCMSGRYDMAWLMEGFFNEDVYFNNPMSYLPGLDGSLLERLRRHAHAILVCGQGRWEDGNIEDTKRMSEILAAKGISHELELWGSDVDHQWTWWRRQARFYLGRRFAR